MTARPNAASSSGPWIALCLLILLLPSTADAARTVSSFAPAFDGPQYTDLSSGTITPLPSLEALDLGERKIELDGRLDEAVWDEAQTGWGFRQCEPDRGTDPSVPSTFKILYDDNAIYVGMACWENDRSLIASYLSRRDQIQASDIVSIYFDPYHDRTTGYNFRVNPEGVQQDAYLFDNGRRDENWNAVWESAVHHDDKGWYVEIRIPFSAIRFKPSDDMVWGLQAYRWMHGRGEDTGWVSWDRQLNGFVSRWGTLTGLRNVDNPRKLELLPYVVTRHTDPATEGVDEFDHFQNFGMDIKYGLASNLTLNATFQPDYGQVEADPANLNLSPFEVFYDEKRPFFIEGARFFKHPEFNLFYSRRIGIGQGNSRIRGAAKLTGKVAGDVSLAVLAAATDVSLDGKVHNPFVTGDQKAYYGLTRVGKEFSDGNHNVNVMGAIVQRDESSFADVDNASLQRNARSAGMDFEMNFLDRRYGVEGSVIATRTEPHDDSLDTQTGHAGTLAAGKQGGNWTGVIEARWESDELNPNDMGFLSAPDEKILVGELEHHYSSDGTDSPFNNAHFELEIYRTLFYGAASGEDIDSGEIAWSYGKDEYQSSGIHFYMQGQHRSYHQGWLFIGTAFDRNEKYTTRTYPTDGGPQGPLFRQPGWINIAGGFDTDFRKSLSVSWDMHGDWGSNLEAYAANAFLRWNQNEHFLHQLGGGWRENRTDAQWMDNFANDGTQAGVVGIGGVDYIFGVLRQSIWSLTLRSSILFDCNHSLQLYLQPYLTKGNYSDPKWLATPAAYDLRDYDLDASAYDFSYGAVNLNVVYRWEYRPGSTFYLVWTHAKERYQERWEVGNTGSWNADFEAGYPFRAEPGNTVMAKLSYWFDL